MLNLTLGNAPAETVILLLGNIPIFFLPLQNTAS